MLIKIGDFWKEANRISENYEGIVCTTNAIVKSDGRLVMGAGIAKQFKERYEDIDLEWGLRTEICGPQVFVTPRKVSLNGKEQTKYLIALPTKHNWKEKSKENYIIHYCRQLRVVIGAVNINKILMTPPGCGLGGLHWPDIRPKLEGILDGRFTVISP